MNKKHIGQTLDDFLEEEGLFAEAEAVASKRVIAFQLSQLRDQQDLPKAGDCQRKTGPGRLTNVD